MIGSNKCVLVTGGAGFIGSHVVREIRRKDPQVKIRVLDDFSTGRPSTLDGVDVELIEGSILYDDIINRALDGVDVVFHLAAKPFIPDCYESPKEFFEVNANGTLNLVLCAVEKKVKLFVNISTSEVYGTAKYVPIDEEHPTNPQSTYAASKLAAENVAFTIHKEKGIPVVILRPFNTYGPEDSHPRIIPEIISQLLAGNTLALGNTKATRDFNYVKDIAVGIVSAAETRDSIGKRINLGTSEETSIQDLIGLLNAIIKKESVEVNIDKRRIRPHDVERLCASNALAKTILKWSPKYSLREGLIETIDWYKKSGGWIWEQKKQTEK